MRQYGEPPRSRHRAALALFPDRSCQSTLQLASKPRPFARASVLRFAPILKSDRSPSYRRLAASWCRRCKRAPDCAGRYLRSWPRNPWHGHRQSLHIAAPIEYRADPAPRTSSRDRFDQPTPSLDPQLIAADVFPNAWNRRPADASFRADPKPAPPSLRALRRSFPSERIAQKGATAV